ncbi:MAG: HNH endonuclease [gamma proteobacterium endosymbiont of Lamellibrachia anaximandri]|nr:HNH endonuclease [gamma proteobacterium endosymbiont of Lamellibrachia anaximandri]
MNFRYTKEHLDYLRSGFQSMQVPELTSAFNEAFSLLKTEKAIKSALSNNRITCGRPPGNPKGKFLSFTDEQGQFIKDNYAGLSLAELRARLNNQFGINKTHQQVRSFTKNHHIRSGSTGQFSKGHKSWNKGTKGLVKSNSGSFRKGNTPISRKPIGSERICTQYGYVLIKVAEPNPYNGQPTRYRSKHVVVWEQEHGPVPAGMVVSFIDGNQLNSAIENLELISRAELLYLNKNGYKDLPGELKPSMRALAKLQAKRFSLLSAGDMPRNMSFALTTDQFKARTKTVTRRLGWGFLKPGDTVMGCRKCMGLKPGEKLERLGLIRILNVRREPLSRMFTEHTYGLMETTKEGFPEMGTLDFIDMLALQENLWVEI